MSELDDVFGKLYLEIEKKAKSYKTLALVTYIPT